LSVNGVGNFYSGVAGLGRMFLGDPDDAGGYIGLYRSSLGPSNSTVIGNSLNFAAIDGYTFSTGAVVFGSQTERMRINSAGNVGIGTTDTSLFNAVGGVTALAVTGSSSSTNITGNTGASISIINTDDTTDNTAGLHFAWQDIDGSPNYAGASIVAKLGVKVASQYPSGELAFLTSTATNNAPSEKMRITSAGNVGIGTTSPSAPLEVNGTATAVRATSAQLWLSRTTASTHYQGICFKTGLARDAFIGRPPNSDDITFGFDAGSVLAEAMRLDTSGNLLVGTTSVSSAKLNVVHAGTYGVYIGAAAGASTPVIFFSGATNTGSISTSGTSTAFNTSSDYRLKEDWQPMTGASERVQALKPVNFAWKVDGSRVDGFLAHEAQEVVPEAVRGTKDAVDKDGKPDYQGIDQSKLVPLLTAALQEALTKIDALTARLDAANL
jgi:hypothetical protein